MDALRSRAILLVFTFTLLFMVHTPSVAEEDSDPSVGTLMVLSEPVTGRVYVDGQYAGMTPLEMSMEPGDHTVLVLRNGFIAAEGVVTVEAGTRTDFVAKLMAAAVLTVTSVPKDADVLVDGEQVGRTPTDVPVRPGTRVIEIVKDGHESWREEIRLTAGERKVLSADLPYRFGRVEIRSIPKGASVFLNEERRGTADPLILDEVIPGEYRLRLTMPTYQDRIREISVERGETVSVVERLEHTLEFQEEDRARREARRSSIRTAVRISGLTIGVVSVAYTAALHKTVGDRKDRYNRTAFTEQAVKYREEVRDWEVKRNLWGSVAALTLSAGLLTFAF